MLENIHGGYIAPPYIVIIIAKNYSKNYHIIYMAKEKYKKHG